MRFEWDESKRAANAAKHGMDFARVPELFDGYRVVERLPYIKEVRWMAVRLLDGAETAVIYTRRGGNIRIISARRARTNERRKYQELYKAANQRDDRSRRG